MTSAPASEQEIQLLNLDDLAPNPRQPRTVFAEDELANLAESIRQDGILQPIIVRPHGTSYEIVAGERRTRAARLAGLTHVPALVRDVDDEDLLRIALLENIQREQLNPIEEAHAYRQLIDDTGMTQIQVAAATGRSRAGISHFLAFLKLPETVQRRIAAGVLTPGHGKALLGLEEPALAEQLAARAVAEGLSVRSLEEIVRLQGTVSLPSQRARNAAARPAELHDLSSALGAWLDTRVKVSLGRNKGRIIIEVASQEDLDRVLSTLGSTPPAGLLDAS